VDTPTQLATKSYAKQDLRWPVCSAMDTRETKRDLVNRYKDATIGRSQRSAMGLAIQNWGSNSRSRFEVEVEGASDGNQRGWFLAKVTFGALSAVDGYIQWAMDGGSMLTVGS